jgi:hypothetical protein
MELITVFFTYFWRRLGRVWWQVALVAMIGYLPIDLVSNFVPTLFPEGSVRDNISVPVDSLLNCLFWSYGICVIFLVIRESDRLDAAFRRATSEEPHPDEADIPYAMKPVPLPSNLGSAAWARWAPLWKPIFMEALYSWPRMIWTRFLYGLVIGMGFLLLCIPGIYVSIKLMVSDIVVVRNRVRGIQALTLSSELTDGQFWRLFALVIMSSIVWLALFIPYFALYYALGYFFPVIDEPYFWFVYAGIAIPLNLLVAYLSVFTASTYDFLLWSRQTPESRPYEDFLSYHPSADGADSRHPLTQDPAV